MDTKGREALCRYLLRPPVAQERVTHGPDGLVRVTLKRPFADGTVAVDLVMQAREWMEAGVGAASKAGDTHAKSELESALSTLE